MRTLLAVVFALNGLWLAGASAQQEDAETTPPAATPAAVEKPAAQLTPSQIRELAAVLKINEALDSETEIDVTDKLLADVLYNLGKKHKIIVVLDPEGCEIAHVSPDQRVNISLSDISLRNALRAILKPMHLGYVIRHEVLTITALDCPERLATVRTFPLGNLIKRMDDPSELISALESVWPEEEERFGEDKPCQPRARILAGHLVVRGSPRHLDIAEQLIDGLMMQRSEPEEKPATATKPASNIKAIPTDEPATQRKPPVRTPPPKPVPPPVEPEAR